MDSLFDAEEQDMVKALDVIMFKLENDEWSEDEVNEIEQEIK